MPPAPQRLARFGKACAFSAVPEVAMLFIAIVCLVLWLLGMMTTYTLGGVLHILLVVAIVLFLVHIIQGSSVGEA
jgi:predicted ferric reductase